MPHLDINYVFSGDTFTIRVPEPVMDYLTEGVADPTERLKDLQLANIRATVSGALMDRLPHEVNDLVNTIQVID